MIQVKRIWTEEIKKVLKGQEKKFQQHLILLLTNAAGVRQASNIFININFY